MRKRGCTHPCADQYLVNYRQIQLEAMKQYLSRGENTYLRASVCAMLYPARDVYIASFLQCGKRNDILKLYTKLPLPSMPLHRMVTTRARTS